MSFDRDIFILPLESGIQTQVLMESELNLYQLDQPTLAPYIFPCANSIQLSESSIEDSPARIPTRMMKERNWCLVLLSLKLFV
ncbi:unnamed protein product [Trifolium pratense]|uniref:Uncharacterized protein n=1 Tax=Trifolium pratense TaxID=57577 RepID=A0ACB0KSK6_TRIPR|nr:unnamed protein product [Trifolium pratense]